MRALKILGGAVALAVCLAPGARADEWNKRTYLTFSGPVQIPGATLPAGTYTFELANPDTTRHVIRVSEKDTNKPIGLFMTIPNDRLNPPDDNLIMFSERPAGQPQAIQAWFYPGDRIGEEFVYPKRQAMQIAKATKKGVLATEAGGVTTASEADRVAAYKGASYGRVDENGNAVKDEAKAETTTAKTNTTPPAATSAPAQTTTARTETTPMARTNTNTSSRANNQTVGTTGAQTNTATNRRRQLPRTASNLVAYELLSGLAFAGAALARRLRN